jgi:pentatricopeptide repeat protein
MANHPKKAIEMLYAMPGYNCWPSTKTFNYVLHMLMCKWQYEVVHEVYTSAPRLGVALDTCCFNILVKGLCQFGKFNEAISLDEMPKQECLPNVTTYSILMHFLCQKGWVDEAFELFERMRKEEIEADTVVCNILISGLYRERRVTFAFDHKSMSSEGCHPNSGTYQVLLDGLVASRMFMEAKGLVRMMSAEGFRPNFSSYKLLIDVLCSVN